MESFQSYREAVRVRAAELSPFFPDGFCVTESIANEQKGSTPGVRVQVRVFDGAKAEIDGVARVVMPEAAATLEVE
jgi:hypothetical protein